MILLEWARRWGISPAAMKELCEVALVLNMHGDTEGSEARVQSERRLFEARRGNYLFRNNVGAGKLASGSFVRFGLGNDSAALNDKFKSADLIGWIPTPIKQEMVGQTIARFYSVEVKRRDWRFAGTLEEMAQVAWATLVNAQGGVGLITNHDGSESP